MKFLIATRRMQNSMKGIKTSNIFFNSNFFVQIRMIRAVYTYKRGSSIKLFSLSKYFYSFLSEFKI